MTKILAAQWVLPISSPRIKAGALAIDDDRIVAVGTRDSLTTQFPVADVKDFENAALSSPEGWLMTPRRTGTDGFFVSVLKRSG